MNRFTFWIHHFKLLLSGSKLVNHNGRRILIHFYDFGDCYMAAASTKDYSVWHCYGSTKKQAQEMALFRMDQFLMKENKVPNEIVENDSYTYFYEPPTH